MADSSRGTLINMVQFRLESYAQFAHTQHFEFSSILSASFQSSILFIFLFLFFFVLSLTSLSLLQTHSVRVFCTVAYLVVA